VINSFVSVFSASGDWLGRLRSVAVSGTIFPHSPSHLSPLPSLPSEDTSQAPYFFPGSPPLLLGRLIDFRRGKAGILIQWQRHDNGFLSGLAPPWIVYDLRLGSIPILLPMRWAHAFAASIFCCEPSSLPVIIS